jgi:hypothetical protein
MRYGRRMVIFSMHVVSTIVLSAVTGCIAQPGQGESDSRRDSVCGTIARRFDTVLSGENLTCRKNTECGCYSQVSINAGCGGVTDRATADRLKALEKEFHQAGCSWPVNCPLWFCDPVCVNGRCGHGR